MEESVDDAVSEDVLEPVGVWVCVKEDVPVVEEVLDEEGVLVSEMEDVVE